MDQHTGERRNAGGRFEMLSDVARELGSDAVLRDIRHLADRVAEGRFYVACLGQFKRGKSTLLNALVGREVLPVGVAPVTSALTVIAHGELPRAQVRHSSGETKTISFDEVAWYVSEESNPENQREVAAVEVFLPHELLASGLCLVDTPGLGSIFAGNTEVTQQFVPHVDAALVVLGADPPISGVELELVKDLSKQVSHLLFVLNKADRLNDRERAEGRAFTERTLSAHLPGRAVRLFEVGAMEALSGGASREWRRS
jgi:GTP-binding protein EngB required for normal cell division